MQKSLFKNIKLEKDRWDYCAGLASIYATSTQKVFRAAIELCFRNNDVFVEFLKNTLENERLENAKRRERGSFQETDESEQP